MNIIRKPIKRKKIKTNYTKKISKKTTNILKSKGKNNFFTLLLYIFLFLVISFIVISSLLYKKYISELPPISELENLEIAESSIIYDREGNELYKIFKEKRTYVHFEDISKNMINAIVAVEDKRYWTNPGVDIKGLFRAGINYIIGKNDKVAGTSTITQQLIRNTVITNERSIERKIKEIYLAYKLTSSVSKDKILELYLNKISYGHNAFGIEEAAKTFFNKSSSELNILESSILASLPKGPTYYSPYNHSDRVVGYPYVYTEENKEDQIKIIDQKDIILNDGMLNLFTNFISGLKASRLGGSDKTVICNINKKYFKNEIRVDNDGCVILKYQDLLWFLNSIRINNDNNYIEYQTGRKDEVLGRMLEDGYINFEEYKKSILGGIGIKFNRSKENIKAAHFVFYVKEYLEEKYGKEIVSIGGLKIYTTLDPKLQDKAEELVKNQSEINKTKFAANNAALISLDNKTGEILSMVGSKDYFDIENKGNVNIITSKLQPGSTFKPFVYSIGIYNNEIGSKTPIYDLETKFPSGYNPNNFDGKFMGKMNISTALNNSRNIPAIKMFFMAGGEKNIVDFMKKIGVDSLKHNGLYGAPLALGTGEMTPLELAKAYSVFANMGEKVETTPILKIVDSKGNIIEEKKKKTSFEKVISDAQTYIINSVLSDTTTRPEFWNNYLSLSDRKVAAKTGTSTKQYMKNGVKDIYPVNLWTAGYTPQITTIVWAGNTDGSKLNYRGNGLEGAGPIFKEFMEFAHKELPVENWKKPSGVKEVNISEISGFLPNPENTNNSLIVKSLFVNKPTKFDNSYRSIKVDSLCNGKVTKNTPEAAIKYATLVEFNSINPSNASWQNPVYEWSKSDAFYEKYGYIKNLITKVNDIECERSGSDSDITIRTTIKEGDTFKVGQNYVELAYKSINPIIKIEVIIEGTIVDEIEIDNKKEGSYVGNFFIPASKSSSQTSITFRAVDKEYYSNSVSKSISIKKEDNIAPEITLVNPIDGSIKLYNTDFFNLKANIKDNSELNSINILIDGELYKGGIKDRFLNIPINSENKLEIGTHVINIVAIDKYLNNSNKEVKLEILQK